MRILITSDAFGGVGRFAAALGRGLRERGHMVTLAIFGGDDKSVGKGVECIGLPHLLEWRSEAALSELQSNVRAARTLVAELATDRQCDLVHSNHFGLAWGMDRPTVLGVHSDVVSWWRAAKQSQPPEDDYHRWYKELVQRALATADAITLPSHAVAEDLRRSYGWRGESVVIGNGLEAKTERTEGSRENVAIAAGRVWDEGKQLRWLETITTSMPVHVYGPWTRPGKSGHRPPQRPGLEWHDVVKQEELQAAMARARVFIGTSCYEPFGLAALEAALAGCALLLHDIASYREIWAQAAMYFANTADLERQLERLAGNAALAARYGAAARARARERYSQTRMTTDYERVYQQLLTRAPAAEMV